MICHHYRCIFVHIPKCAGQSVERIFVDRVGLTWATRAPLLLRRNDMPELGPPRLAHLTAPDYLACKYVTPHQFESYFKFAIVRNPWDRMVSFYKYLGFYKSVDFKRFVNGYFMHRLWARKYWFVRPQCEFLYDVHNKCLMDYVGRFELLPTSMEYVSKRVGLRVGNMHRSNESRKEQSRPNGYVRNLGRATIHRCLNRWKAMPNDYRAYYDHTSVAKVADLYRRDIELFGYEFDPSHRHKLRP